MKLLSSSRVLRACRVWFQIPVLLLVAGCAAAGTADRPWTSTVAESHAGAASGPLSAPSFAEAQRQGRTTLNFIYVPSSGFAYRDAQGELTGVTVELLRDFAAYVAIVHGIRTEVRWTEEERWANFYGYVRDSAGGVFGIGNVTITESRRAELAFSPPYLNNIAVLVTHERVPELSSMSEVGTAFGDLTALPYPGTLHETRLHSLRDRWMPGMRSREVASNDELVSLLASDDGYFGYIDIYNYWRARQAGQPLRRHPVGDDSSETFGVILPRGSDWAPVMEEFFNRGGGYPQSERFVGLLQTHLGEELASLLSGG